MPLKSIAHIPFLQGERFACTRRSAGFVVANKAQGRQARQGQLLQQAWVPAHVSCLHTHSYLSWLDGLRATSKNNQHTHPLPPCRVWALVRLKSITQCAKLYLPAQA
eukprot:523367-Pelagomonas_calceolata.AAC.2